MSTNLRALCKEALHPCRLQGVLYIEEPVAWGQRHTAGGTAPAQSERQRLMSYWGVKFEQYSTWATRDRPSLAERREHCAQPVNNKEAFCTVVHTRLGSHALTLGAEVDCAGSSLRS